MRYKIKGVVGARGRRSRLGVGTAPGSDAWSRDADVGDDGDEKPSGHGAPGRMNEPGQLAGISGRANTAARTASGASAALESDGDAL